MIDLMLIWIGKSDSNTVITIVVNYRDISEFGSKS